MRSYEKYRCVGVAYMSSFTGTEAQQEHFADYAPLLPCLFSLNHTPSASDPLYGQSPNAWAPKALDRSVQGILAVLLSLKKKPVIRYEKMSGMAKKLATEIQVFIMQFLSHLWSLICAIASYQE